MPATFPSPFPAHQGLVYPLARRWPNSYDVIALSVGAAMPDFVDIVFGFLLNGYFRHWFAHGLIFIPFNVLGGLMLTWLIKNLFSKLFKLKTPVEPEKQKGKASRLKVWTFSVTVGVLSHLFFDLFSHDTNLLLYPWYVDAHWFPQWWYTPWFVSHLRLAWGQRIQLEYTHLYGWSLPLLGLFGSISWFFKK